MKVERERLRLRLECFRIGAAADDDGADRMGRHDTSQRIEQNVDTLERTQLADEQEVGGVGIRRPHIEIRGPQPVGDDAPRRPPGARESRVG